MEPRQAIEELRALQQFSGAWAGEETLFDTKVTKAGKAKARWTFRSACGGAFVIAEYDEDGGPDMKGHGVIGWDAQRREYTLHWFDNFGMPPKEPGYGSFADDELTFTHGTHGRTSFAVERGALTVSIEMNVDGAGFTPAVIGRYAKDEGARGVDVGGAGGDPEYAVATDAAG